MECSQKLKALSDPIRFRVVRTLAGAEKTVTQLEQELSVEQSLLSHHLRILRDNNLIIASRYGKFRSYRLHPDCATDQQRDRLELGCCAIEF